MKKYKIAAVSYLNTKPLLHGLNLINLQEEIDLCIDYPSSCGQRLLNDEVDFALVPVAVLPSLVNYSIVSDYCIGCDGAVQTVCIYSDKPIEEVKTIYTDFHSRTSIELSKILLREYWKKDVPFVHTGESIEGNYESGAGVMAIGDKTIRMDKKYKYKYDLGEAWKSHTGLPFVFAVWVSKKNLPETFTKKLNKAFEKGIAEIDALITSLQNVEGDFDLKKYFNDYIDYHLDAKKLEALNLFLKKMQKNKRSYTSELSLV